MRKKDVGRRRLAATALGLGLALSACLALGTRTEPGPALASAVPVETFASATQARPAAAAGLQHTPTPLPTSTATATQAASPTSPPTATAPTATSEPPTASATPEGLVTGDFVDEEVAVTGSYTLDPASGILRLSADFELRPGPDLYIILSGASDLTVDYITFSQMVTASPLLTVGPLLNTSGAQDYTIPPGTDLSPYKTVVVWCRPYSVAFAAAPLTLP